MTDYVTPGDWRSHRRAGALIVLAAAAVVLLVVLVNVLHASPTATETGGAAASNGSGSAMAGMTGMTAAPPVAVKGIPTVKAASLPSMPASAPMAMPMTPLGNAVWDGMSIQARTSAPATFELFDGSSQQLVRPTARDSFHLMVLLSDRQSGFPIPYSSVWATIRKDGKIVYDERLWPMISRYMGPHYGANVALPAAGLYHLTLLVSPPAAARHLEYKDLWLRPHRVQLEFRWVPKAG